MSPIIARLTASADPKLFEPMLSAEDVGESLGLHPKTVLAMARRGKIPAFRIGIMRRG